MRSVTINYQTSFMPYSKAIKLYKNILNDFYKNEPGFKKIQLKSRNTIDIYHELADYLEANHFNDTISNFCYNNPNPFLKKSDDPGDNTFVIFNSIKRISNNCSLTIAFVAGYTNYNNYSGSIHVYIDNDIVDDNNEKSNSYQNISIDPDIINQEITSKIMPAEFDDIIKKYNMECVGLNIIKREDED